jgi:uncharacterized membrane protein (GlpM family)
VIPEKLVTVLLSVLIVVMVAVVQDHSRHLAAIIATMPLTAPLAMWIVYSASRDQRQTADFVGSMLVGIVGNVVFVLTCWLGFRREWGFLTTLALGAAVWLLIVLLPRWVGASTR